ncbi:MAG: hypothetical protein ACJAZM_002016 [Cyclobacteriaceae bacterium]|jgi:hypothetical protein
MRKISFLIVALCAVSFAQAQSIGLGIKGGLNFPSADALGVADGVTIEDASNASGYHAGLFVSAKVAMFQIQPEILYSFQSFEYDFSQANVGNTVASATQDFHYVTIPIIVKFSPVPVLNVQVGPQFGMLLSANQVGDIAGNAASFDIEDELASTDIGLNLGVGADLPFGLQVSARYVIGLSDVNKESPADIKVNNSMIQLSIGYAFLGK